jgi:predicted nucleotidyltransferase
MAVWTLAERKAADVAAKTAAADELLRALTSQAWEIGGRYLLYGSAARGELRPDSDVDLLLDFPDSDATATAWGFAEDECARLGLDCDIRPIAMCEPHFLDHVLPGVRSLP